MGAPVPLKLTEINTELDATIFVTHAPGDESRLFAVLREGVVVILDPASGAVQGTFLDISDIVTAAAARGGEYGMLGMAFHPNYPEDPRIFVNYTSDLDSGGSIFDTYVSSFEVSSNPNAIDMASERELVRFGQPRDNHNGGMLAFGWDNCLYISSGDGGFDPDLAQDLSSPLGKILRMDVDNPTARAPGNLASASHNLIWSYGLRNPWRFSFDRENGDIYIGDVGQDTYEEINIAPRGTGHQNYGWPLMEGSDCDRPPCNGLEGPSYEYENQGGQQSENCVIGGYVYRGSAIPSLYGYYIYGDNGPGQVITAIAWDGDSVCGAPIKISQRDGFDIGAEVSNRINSFGEDAAGNLYLATSRGIYRIDAL